MHSVRWAQYWPFEKHSYRFHPDLRNCFLLWQNQNKQNVLFWNGLLTCQSQKIFCFAKAKNNCAGQVPPVMNDGRKRNRRGGELVGLVVCFLLSNLHYYYSMAKLCAPAVKVIVAELRVSAVKTVVAELQASGVKATVAVLRTHVVKVIVAELRVPVVKMIVLEKTFYGLLDAKMSRRYQRTSSSHLAGRYWHYLQ